VTDAGISGPERRGYVVTHRLTVPPQHKRQHVTGIKMETVQHIRKESLQRT